MGTIRVELCPETGICSLVKGGTDKVDLLPFEVDALREAGDDPDAIRKIVADSDGTFANGLSVEELHGIAQRLASHAARRAK